jgi:hypothetical protein
MLLSLDKTYDSLIDEIYFQMVWSHKKKTMFDNRCAMNQITNIAWLADTFFADYSILQYVAYNITKIACLADTFWQ